MAHPNEKALVRCADIGVQLKQLSGENDIPDPVKQKMIAFADELAGMKPATDDTKPEGSPHQLGDYKKRTGMETFRPAIAPAVPSAPNYAGLLAEPPPAAKV
jgi:hypothetical protein